VFHIQYKFTVVVSENAVVHTMKLLGKNVGVHICYRLIPIEYCDPDKLDLMPEGAPYPFAEVVGEGREGRCQL